MPYFWQHPTRLGESGVFILENAFFKSWAQSQKKIVKISSWGDILGFQLIS
jgi:hypothetical protein